MQSTRVKRTGYSGLMIPIMEDNVLAKRWSEGTFTLDSILAYSAVCAGGVDTSRFLATYRKIRSPEFSETSRGSPIDGINRSRRVCFPRQASESAIKQSFQAAFWSRPEFNRFPARGRTSKPTPLQNAGQLGFGVGSALEIHAKGGQKLTPHCSGRRPNIECRGFHCGAELVGVEKPNRKL